MRSCVCLYAFGVENHKHLHLRGGASNVVDVNIYTNVSCNIHQFDVWISFVWRMHTHFVYSKHHCTCSYCVNSFTLHRMLFMRHTVEINSYTITIKINEAHLKTKKMPFVRVDELYSGFLHSTIVND